jgi:hypothetical protein
MEPPRGVPARYPAKVRPPDLARAAVFLAAWAGLVAFAVFGAPPGDGLDGERVLAWFQLQGDPLPVATFNLLGVWPLVYGAVLLRDPPQRVPAWPFVALSFVVGGFVLLPCLALRRWGAPARREPGLVRRALTGRGLAAVLVLAAVALVAWALGWGDPEAMAALWERSPLVTTMTADLAVVTVAWWALLVDDVRRHGGPAWAAVLGAVPIVGAPVWLLARRAPTTERSGGEQAGAADDQRPVA